MGTILLVIIIITYLIVERTEVRMYNIIIVIIRSQLVAVNFIVYACHHTPTTIRDCETYYHCRPFVVCIN